MSQRERWIIYPLLFFCFSMCIKLYWYPPDHDLKAKHIVCQSLLIQDEYERPLVRAAGRANGDGYLMVLAAPAPDAPGRAPLEAVRLSVSPNRRGVVETLSEVGLRLVEVSGDNRGGNVALFDTAGRPIYIHLPASVPEDPRTAPVRPPIPPIESAPAEAPATSPSTAVGSSAT